MFKHHKGSKYVFLANIESKYIKIICLFSSLTIYLFRPAQFNDLSFTAGRTCWLMWYLPKVLHMCHLKRMTVNASFFLFYIRVLYFFYKNIMIDLFPGNN